MDNLIESVFLTIISKLRFGMRLTVCVHSAKPKCIVSVPLRDLICNSWF